MDDRIARAKWLLENVKHGAMATVNEDGSPHNTPYFFMSSTDLSKLYWGSHKNSIHSQNILRTGKLFVVLYGELEGGGLYIQAENGRVAQDNELDEALARHNDLRKRIANKESLSKEYYLESEQDMWIADVTQLWVNKADRYDNGRLREDLRHEISASDIGEIL